MFFSLLCVCSRSYLILGNEGEGLGAGLTVTERSIVIEWQKDWSSRLRRFQQRSRFCV